MDDVEERLVDLADVVEQRDAFDVTFLGRVEVGRVGQDQRIPSDAADVGTRLMVVRVDRAKQCLEHSGSKSLRRQTALSLANE